MYGIVLCIWIVLFFNLQLFYIFILTLILQCKALNKSIFSFSVLYINLIYYVYLFIKIDSFCHLAYDTIHAYQKEQILNYIVTTSKVAKRCFW